MRSGNTATLLKRRWKGQTTQEVRRSDKPRLAQLIWEEKMKIHSNKYYLKCLILQFKVLLRDLNPSSPDRVSGFGSVWSLKLRKAWVLGLARLGSLSYEMYLNIYYISPLSLSLTVSSLLSSVSWRRTLETSISMEN